MEACLTPNLNVGNKWMPRLTPNFDNVGNKEWPQLTPNSNEQLS